MDDSRLGVENFQAIEIRDPSAVIIEQIRKLIADGTLKPGVSLPSERELAERFAVGRGHIRKALSKLEFYGILKTIPKRGTIVASIGVKAIEGLLSNILQFEKRDIRSLLETRAILEKNSASLAAERATDKELAELDACLEEFRVKALRGTQAMEEDHVFHLKIAAMSGNTVLLSLISLITPDVISMNRKFKELDQWRFQKTLEEHEAIARAIAEHDPSAAMAAMENHMTMSMKRRIVREDAVR